MCQNKMLLEFNYEIDLHHALLAHCAAAHDNEAHLCVVLKGRALIKSLNCVGRTEEGTEDAP